MTDPLTGDPLTDFRNVYTNGYCHILAMALHKEFGWPAVFIMRRFDDGYSRYIHAAVRHTPGRLMDALGSATDADMLKRYPGSWLVNLDDEIADALTMARYFLAALDWSPDVSDGSGKF